MPVSYNDKKLDFDTVTFTAAYAKPLENIYKYGLRDIYSPVILIDPQDFYNLKDAGMFSNNSKIAVATLEKYRKNLFGNEKKILTVLKNESKKHPDKTLSEIVNNLYIPHRKKLREAQKPIFDSLINKSKLMPEEYRLRFNELMAITEKKLEDKPNIYEFSAKEFAYKLEKMSASVSNPNNKKKILKYADLLNSDKLKQAPDILSISFIEELYSVKKSKKFSIIQTDKLKQQINKLNSKNLSYKKAERLKKKIYKNVQNIFGKDSNLTINELYDMYNINKKNTEIKTIKKEKIQLKILNNIKYLINKNESPELKNLCNIAECMIKKEPVNIPFSRKSFLYDLSRALEGLPDESLRRDMIKTAYTLPTSSNNVSAFILKYFNTSSDKIAYAILNPSFCSIEHIKPESLGGASDMSNYIVASRRRNSERGNQDLSIYLKNFPKWYVQKGFNRYIELANEGLFNPDYVIAMKKAMEEQGGIKLSTRKLKLEEARYAYKLNNMRNKAA